MQKNWPDTRISWIIGKTEYELVKGINDVEFIIFDKSRGIRAYGDIYRQLNGKHFDVLLHMQLSLRASICSLLIRSKMKLGFDKARAKDLQWLFTSHRIKPASTRQHVVDSFLEFTRYFHLKPVMQWELPVSQTTLKNHRYLIDGDKKILVINACAAAKSRDWRDWSAEGYAAVADYAASQHGMAVILSGGLSPREINMADTIFSLCNEKPTNLVGKTSIAELTDILDKANVVIAPDTGPAHLASSLGTPVIGLYASTNPQRAGPYCFMKYVVNKYPQALQHFFGQSVSDAPWGKRIPEPESMQFITVDEVIQMLEKVIKETF